MAYSVTVFGIFKNIKDKYLISLYILGYRWKYGLANICYNGTGLNAKMEPVADAKLQIAETPTQVDCHKNYTFG